MSKCPDWIIVKLANLSENWVCTHISSTLNLNNLPDNLLSEYPPGLEEPENDDKSVNVYGITKI